VSRNVRIVHAQALGGAEAYRKAQTKSEEPGQDHNLVIPGEVLDDEVAAEQPGEDKDAR
jgi:hypothetical protein